MARKGSRPIETQMARIGRINPKKSKSRRRSKKKSRSLKRRRFSFGDVWTVYTLDGCPYCTAAVELLKSKKYTVTVKRGEESEKELKGRVPADFTTWPKIFKNDKFIGGNGTIQELNDKGKL